MKNAQAGLLLMVIEAACLLALAACEPAHRPYPAMSPPAAPAASGFSDMDVTIIRDYYRRFGAPAFSAAPRYPHWLQQQLQRGALMPQGLIVELLPPDLERLLLPLPPEYVRLRAGDDVILLDRPMNVIVDVVKGAVR